MRINWKKIVLLVGVTALVLGMFAKPASAEEVGGMFFTYIEAKSLDEAVNLASDISMAEKALGVLHAGKFGIRREKVTKGPYAGKEVLVQGDSLVTFDATDIATFPIKPKGKFIKVDGKTVLLTNGEITQGENVVDNPVGAAVNTAVNNPISQGVWSIAMKAFSVILAAAQLVVAFFLQWLMYAMDILLNTGNILNNKGIQNGWTAIRDLCNMFFILILLAIAFMTVFLGTEGSSYSIKRALPMLVVAVLTINFSFFICKIMVEAADIISRSFVTKNEAGILGDVMGLQKLGNIKLPSSAEGSKAIEDIIGGEPSTPSGGGASQ